MKGFIPIQVKMVRYLISPEPSYSMNYMDVDWKNEMKKAILLLLVSGLSALAVIGCGNETANLQKETARYIGGLTSEQVTVYDVDRSMMDVKWKADTPNGKYSCEADQRVRGVKCVKK